MRGILAAARVHHATREAWPTWPLAARAQQGDHIRRIGVLQGQSAEDPESKARSAAFEQALQQLGWIQGRNVRIDWSTTAGGDAATSRKQAEELVALAPDVIMSTGGFSTGSYFGLTHTVPIVFAIVPDPVGSGYVDSLAQPAVMPPASCSSNMV